VAAHKKRELLRVKFFAATISADTMSLFVYMNNLKMIAFA
jgi:hypothetical protein